MIDYKFKDKLQEKTCVPGRSYSLVSNYLGEKSIFLAFHKAHTLPYGPTTLQRPTEPYTALQVFRR